MAKTVLIAGAGIAGPTLAYWLRRDGFTPVLVERAPAFRTGGYIIDFWGSGFGVAERMGLLPSLRERGYGIDRLLYLDAGGGTRSALDATAVRRALGDRFVSLARGDLARVIYDLVDGDVEAIFGDRIRDLHDDGDGVDVTFASGAARRFDLVVGCDGVHSEVRAALFGRDRDFTSYLGYLAASFVTRGYPHRDPDAYVSFAAPGRQISRYALRDDRTAFLFVCARDAPPETHDRAAHERLLLEAFADDDWRELPEIRARLADADDLYFDTVSQVRVPSWSRGRVALLGDAAYAPSLLAGAGAALAMAGAYVLAAELRRAGGDHRVAFAAYERSFRPFIDDRQQSARRFASSFTPRTRLGLFVRDQLLKVMNVPVLGDWMIRRTVADDFVLPDDTARA